MKVKPEGTKEESESFLQKINLFKEPVNIPFGGFLTAMIPIILAGYAACVIYQRISATKAPIVSTVYLNDDIDYFTLNVTCISDYGCSLLVYDPYDLVDYGYSDIEPFSEPLFMENGDTTEVNLYYSSTTPALFIAHRVCSVNSGLQQVNQTVCLKDFNNGPALNDPLFWATFPNGTASLPSFPLQFNTQLDPNEGLGGNITVNGQVRQTPMNPVWAATLKFYQMTNATNDTAQGAKIISTDSQTTSYYNLDDGWQGYEDIFGPILAEACRLDCITNDTNYDYSSFNTSSMNYVPVYINSDFDTTKIVALDMGNIVMEVAGQVGGVYGLVVSFLQAVYTGYLFFTGKSKPKELTSNLEKVASGVNFEVLKSIPI